MLIDFPVVNLPNDLLNLLQSEFHNGRDSLTKLSIEVEKTPGLRQIIKKTMGEFDADKRVETIIKHLGFEAFRSRLSSVYLEKFEHGFFPPASSLDRTQKITDLTNQVQELTVMNSSRAFLLGVYLEFAHLKLEKDGLLSHMNIPAEVINLLLLKKSKNTTIDWLILMTWHFVEYFGHKEFTELLKRYNNDYENIYLSMNEDSRYKMMSNLLSYGTSIQDYDTFIYERV
jgi:hypothetical protein